ncbi:GMC oxidoreductase-domain-containing protein [Colletotrichum navitas]|uniref:GMC oxidoreductase-domain-containing protein n=1 Tax=Colletotrichum navitas TaxID=681940 RepID=A0AAD8Q1U7_9PEZI|nr:GMC oxidoreductase-domain-containing protein [Colletotrichum navitas]KAK1593697.1 GMC oxidoreductase-domain-containing protein [Colletotrichum navitas]
MSYINYSPDGASLKAMDVLGELGLAVPLIDSKQQQPWRRWPRARLVTGAVLEGYLAQLEVLTQALEHPEHSILEMPFHAGPGTAFILKPLSRDSVVLNSTDHDATPVVNYATGANPIDFDIMVTYVDYFYRLYSADAWQAHGDVEVAPGVDVTEHDALIEYIKRTVIQSLMHPCCIAAMLPREKGCVVDSSLSVHGISGLRVADCSIILTIPGSHTTTTAYAIGKKAAEIIHRRWKSM